MEGLKGSIEVGEVRKKERKKGRDGFRRMSVEALTQANHHANKIKKETGL